MASEKKIVDQVSDWLRVFDDGSVDRTWTGPAHLKSLIVPVPPTNEFVDGVATLDITIGPNPTESARIYIPEIKPTSDYQNPTPKLPLLLHFHGGGFCISRADWYMYHQFYTRLVKTTRAICVSPEMRLAPEDRLPAAIDDCFAALKWISSVARAEQHEPWLGVQADFSRVFLIGDSAGGNLVHEVAALAGSDELGPLRIAGGVLLHPGFVRSERSKSELALLPESALLTLEMVDKFLAMALPIGSSKDHPITCPMGPLAPPLSTLRLPPFLVAVAQKDLIRDTQLEYVEEMKKALKDVELVINSDMGHCFYLDKIGIDSNPKIAAQTDILLAAIEDFIRRH